MVAKAKGDEPTQGGKVLPCLKMFVEVNEAADKCKGLGSESPDEPVEGNWKQFEVRAVKYVPRPIGVGSDSDVYTVAFKFIYERDLKAIAEVTRANTVTLGPWDVYADHSDFLETCSRNGLHVIPTFDFKAYVKPTFKATAGDIRQQLGQDFEEFLSVASSVPNAPILAWSLNYGLDVHEEVKLGALSNSFPSNDLKNYFALLCYLRHVHRNKEYDAKIGAYKRPLAVPLDLNTLKSTDDIGWFTGFVESNWGNWPDCPFWENSPMNFGDEVGSLRRLGSFDIWLAQGLFLPKDSKVSSALAAAAALNATLNVTGSGIRWPDTQDRSRSDAVGKAYEGCAETGCTFPVRKAVIMQFGFSSRVTKMQPGIHLETDPTNQMEKLQGFWSELKEMTEKRNQLGGASTCASGGVVDEWVDDWDRNTGYGCEASPYRHALDEHCAELHDQGQVYPEWFGINAQYSLYGLQCIDPRQNDKGNWFCFANEEGDVTREPCPILLDPSEWSPLMPTQFRFAVKCRAYAVSFLLGKKVVPIGPAIVVWVFLLLIFPVGRLIRVKCCLRPRSSDASDSEGERDPVSFSTTIPSASSKSDVEDMAGTPTSASSTPASSEGGSPAAAVPELHESVEVAVPRCFHDAQRPQHSKFVIELIFSKKRKGKAGMQAFSKEFARLFLESHSMVQARRLWQQIEAEAWAAQAPTKDGPGLGEEESFKVAMANIHARVMEGYLVWLEKNATAHKNPRELKLVKQLLTTGNEEDARSSALLYMDALLLRTIESLAEQALHAPEFIAYNYHRARWPHSQDDEDTEIGTLLKFSIDYESLHAGIQSMCENGNPYAGGINFDDINDCALDNAPTMNLRKTFHESPSILVLVDVFSNFEPVFTLKMWIFYLSWMLHHLLIGEKNTAKPLTVLEIGLALLFIDATMLTTIETATIILGFKQGRCFWKFGRSLWIVRRSLSLLNAGFGLFMWLHPKVVGSEAMVCLIYWGLRILFFIATAVPLRSIPFLRGTPEGVAGGGQAIKKPKIVKYRRLIWIFMLAACLLFETFLVVPLAYGLHFDEFCQDACDLSPGNRMWLSSSCISCLGAVATIWFIVALTAFFDIYYMFYLGTALVGYAQGHTKGLTNVLQTAQRQVDLSCQKRRESHDVKEYSQMTDARVMRKLFGAGWRMLWSRMAESLHEENMISSDEVDLIVKSAGTVRWSKREEAMDKMVLAEDRFVALRFTPTARRVAEDKEDLAGTSAASGMMVASPGETGPCIERIIVRPRRLDNELIVINCTEENLSKEKKDADKGVIKVSLGKPTPVHEFFFDTASDEDSEAKDPVQWRLEGCLESDTWKELIVQSATFVPSTSRGFREGPWPVELWRLAGSQDGKLSLDKIRGAGALERLTFFVSSLHHVAKHSKETLVNAHHGSIPSLTQILPCYDETVINDAKMLRESDGVNTNLAFIISQYEYEWTVFCERMKCPPDRLYEAFVRDELPEDLLMEVRMWAAMRSQTVARTVVGAMQYHEVLSLIPSTAPSPVHSSLGQLILAHQTFGSKKGKPDNDAAVLHLLEKYQKWPIFVVFDYDRNNSLDAIKNLVENAGSKLYPSASKCRTGPRFASVMVRFNREHSSAGQKPGVIPYKDAIEVVEILPRYYPLLIGSKNFMTQGKAGNQLGALRFAAGHFVQMMDANMGASFGEACKVPFVLRMFQPPGTDRKRVLCRILGFRELIFTKDHGTMGDIMASAEWSFGTICQRFLAGLDVRMHYGHPDFIDAFWASNRGSLSKASPAINLSEDIFAGFNARMRGERSHHIDSLAWEKGRESSFNAASLFFTKVSKGNVGVMRSRDLKILTERLGMFDNLSFYFASIGFYLNNWLIDISMSVYVFLFVLLAFSSKDLDSVGKLGSMLAVEWIVSMGVVAMLPRLAELVLEYGYFEGLIKFFPSIPGIMLAFTFINKSIASGVSEAMMTGEAKYIATGRPNANTHYSWRECYLVHSSTHYYPAIGIAIWFVIYTAISRQMNMSSLPMMVILATAGAWIVAPLLFCPQPTWTSLARDSTELWKFIVATPKRSVRRLPLNGALEDALHTGIKDTQATLYEVWLLKALEHKRHSIKLQCACVVWDLLILAVLGGLVHSRVYESLWTLLKFFTLHCLLLECWRMFGRPEILVLAAFTVALPLPLFMYPSLDFANTIVAFTLLGAWMNFMTGFFLSVARLCLRPNVDWPSMPDKTEEQAAKKREAAGRDQMYNIVVEYFYVNFMSYEMHLMKGLAVLAINFATQLPMVLLDFLTGLHSQLLLNSNLGCRQGVCGARAPYTPSGGGAAAAAMAPGPSERVGVRASLTSVGMRFRRMGSGRLSRSGSSLGGAAAAPPGGSGTFGGTASFLAASFPGTLELHDYGRGPGDGGAARQLPMPPLAPASGDTGVAPTGSGAGSPAAWRSRGTTLPRFGAKESSGSEGERRRGSSGDLAEAPAPEAMEQGGKRASVPLLPVAR